MKMSYPIQMHIDDETAEKLRVLAVKNHLTHAGAAASIIFQFFTTGPGILTRKAPRVKLISRPTWRLPEDEQDAHPEKGVRKPKNTGKTLK